MSSEAAGRQRLMVGCRSIVGFYYPIRDAAMTLVKRYTVAVVCCAGLIGAGPAWAAKDTFTASPVDDRCDDFLSGRDLNESAAVVAHCGYPDEIDWFTGPDGLGVSYSPAGAYASIGGINDWGQLVGSAAGRAYVTGPNGVGLRDIHPPGASSSFASGINRRGQVVGTVTLNSGEGRAFMSNRQNTQLRLLATLGGDGMYSPTLNGKGRVAGSAKTAAGQTHAFVTGPDGAGITDLGTLGGIRSEAHDINADGQVVGEAEDAGGVVRAFITAADGSGLLDLSRLGINRGFDGFAVAYSINDEGFVVGTGAIEREPRYAGFITGRNGVGMKNLNDFVKLPDGKVYSAKAINNRGEILIEVNWVDSPLWILKPTRPTWREELQAD